jgi:hypothetical protein
MKRYVLFLVLITVLALNSYSQITFEKGYFINESDQKVNCLIKNIDWKNNPSEFEYKISPEASIQNADIKTVKEFGIDGVSRYIRAKIQIDRSRDEIYNLNFEMNPVFQEEMLFLKVLIEGKASLFFYANENITRFFMK